MQFWILSVTLLLLSPITGNMCGEKGFFPHCFLYLVFPVFFLIFQSEKKENCSLNGNCHYYFEKNILKILRKNEKIFSNFSAVGIFPLAESCWSTQQSTAASSKKEGSNGVVVGGLALGSSWIPQQAWRPPQTLANSLQTIRVRACFLNHGHL